MKVFGIFVSKQYLPMKMNPMTIHPNGEFAAFFKDASVKKIIVEYNDGEYCEFQKEEEAY